MKGLFWSIAYLLELSYFALEWGIVIVWFGFVVMPVCVTLQVFCGICGGCTCFCDFS